MQLVVMRKAGFGMAAIAALQAMVRQWPLATTSLKSQHTILLLRMQKTHHCFKARAAFSRDLHEHTRRQISSYPEWIDDGNGDVEGFGKMSNLT